ncbi:MAG TPA: polysaccharide biosynthesis tyrosine autokinase [Gemmatimonadales bacterium]|nr:polysaccharide biosynthesis tyrosine autokinase [Gemmatimonadales bacterium]
MPSNGTPSPVEPTFVVPTRAAVPAAARVRRIPAPPDDWRRVLLAIGTFRWLVVGVTVAGTLAGIAGSRFLKPAYEARATVWIEIPDPASRSRDEGPLQTGELLGTSSGWLDLLRSHVVLDDVVRQQRLYLKPKGAQDTAALATLTASGDARPGRYRLVVDAAGTQVQLLDVAQETVIEQDSLGAPVGAAAGLAWVPPVGALQPGSRVDFTVTTTAEAAEALAEELRIRAVPEGNFVRIARRGSDPMHVTNVVNAVADRFVTAAADLKRQRVTELTAILKDQLDQAQASLRATESALTNFRVRNAVRPSEGPAQGPDGRRITADPTYARYAEVQGAIDALQHDREAIAQVLAEGADSGVSVDQLSMIAAVQRSSELTAALRELTDRQAELRALRSRYADTHPPVRRAAAQVDTLARRVVPALGRTLMAGLAARERALAERRDSIAGDLRSAPPVALSEVRLTRDLANAEKLFSNLQARYEEARLAEASTLPDVRILERAVPPTRPTSNTAPLLMVVAFVTSLGAGVAAAVVRDRADSKVRYADQVMRTIGVPILGAVPHVERNGKRPGRHEAGAHDGDEARAWEALRSIRLNVQHAYGAAGPVLVTITSPGRGEGKSFVSSNLARAFAGLGYRTLLIDGDVRLGGLHRAVRRARRPGLTDILAGQSDADAAIQTTAHPQLRFLGSGSRMHRGPELVSSAALPRLIAAMRGAYDVILVDSAPLAAGVDPYALATATGSVVLVLRSRVTDLSVAEPMVEMLQGLPLRVLGAVLNDVRPGAAYGYYSYAYTVDSEEIGNEDPEGVEEQILLPDRS